MKAAGVGWILVALLFVAYPAWALKFEAVQEHLNTFVGKPIDTAVALWGPPAQDRELVGKHWVTWRNERWSSYQGTGSTHYCEVNFMIDANNVIREAQLRTSGFGSGPLCKMFMEKP